MGAVPVALTALVVALVPTGGRDARPLPLATQDAPRHVVGYVWAKKGGARFARIDTRTLAAGRARSARVASVDGWTYEQSSRHVLAVASADDYPYTKADSIHFFDVSTLRQVRKPILLDGFAHYLLWSDPHRLVAVLNDCCGVSGSRVVRVDPTTRTIVETARLPGSVARVRRIGRALVVLQMPAREIGPARLDVIDADGGVRSVELEVLAGSFLTFDGDAPTTTQRLPALAVDPSARRAYVIQPEGPAAEVDVDTLAVSYHGLRASRSVAARLDAWLTPTANAKFVNGAVRSALWLGDGLIAVTGGEATTERDPTGQMRGAAHPAGLAIVDTRDWTVQMVDSNVNVAIQAGGLLLATGSTTGDDGKANATGLMAFGPDRTRKFTAFRGLNVWVALVAAGRAYVQVDTGPPLFVVDLASGRVVGKWSKQLPMLLVGDGST